MSVLNNAADVLRCFGNDCPDLTVTDVVRLLGMPKANASRLLKAMREANMLETIGDSPPPTSVLVDCSTHRAYCRFGQFGGTLIRVMNMLVYQPVLSCRRSAIGSLRHYKVTLKAEAAIFSQAVRFSG